jgi:hypothetical protein
MIERQRIVSTNTVTLHRVLRAPPERVYKAFLDADAMAKWLPPHGFTGKVHHLKAEVGGTYKCRSRTSGADIAIPSAASISSSFRTSGFAIPTSSTIRTCPAR